MLTLSDIYDFITEKFPFYKERKTWKNSLRHTLSLNKCFQKVPREGHRNFWTINPDCDHVIEQGKFQSPVRRENRRKMKDPL